MKCEIYRPYGSPVKTAMTLSKSDRMLMKLRSARLIGYVCERKKWIEPTGMAFIVPAHSLKYYWNDGKVRLDFLIEYYYTMHLYCLKSSGDKCHLLSFDCQAVYEEHRDECCDDSEWDLSQKQIHRSYLLKSDRRWYGRFWGGMEEVDETKLY